MSAVGDFWNDLSGQRKVGLLLGVLTIVLLVTLLSTWVFRTEFDVLFSDLNDTDAATITEELESLKIPYQLSDNGQSVLVEKASVHEARLKLTSSGALVKGGVGFELFDNAEYGMSDFAQKINYQRAIQGELSRTIMSMSEVKGARVHLVLPSSTLFRRNDTEEATASISLLLEDSAHLNQEQVVGIQRLVAGAVKKLEMKNVLIVDQSGIVLTANKKDDTQELLARLEKKKRIETYLTQKVRSIMDNMFGAGAAVVNIDATLNFDKIESQVEKVLPGSTGDNKGIISRSVDSRVIKADKAAITKGSDSKGRKNNNSIVNESAEIEYKLGKAVERVVHSIGNVTRLTISVMVPNTTSESDVRALQGLIGSAVGLNPERGDIIEIHPLAATNSHSYTESNPVQYPIADISGTEVQAASPSTQHNNADTITAALASVSPQLLTIVAVIVTALILLIISLLMRKPKRERLDAQSRENVLLELKTWLNEDEQKQGVAS